MVFSAWAIGAILRYEVSFAPAPANASILSSTGSFCPGQKLLIWAVSVKSWNPSVPRSSAVWKSDISASGVITNLPPLMIGSNVCTILFSLDTWLCTSTT